VDRLRGRDHSGVHRYWFDLQPVTPETSSTIAGWVVVLGLIGALFWTYFVA
jgi:hypothetical protein